MRLAPYAAALTVALVCASPALADDWLPHPADATWTYEWTNSVYNTTPTKEKVTVEEQKGKSFTLAWTTVNQGNASAAPVSVGSISFQETLAGLVNTDWRSNAAPADFPVLCPKVSPCGNSLASTYYNVIWGTRAPVLAGPLLRQTTWNATGGWQDDVASSSYYAGVENVTVPAFPYPVSAAKVRSDVTQAGALGDPFGSGVRTVWWVYGVGPVKVVFQHAGSDSPVTTSVLTSTNQTPKPAPSDTRYFPVAKGMKWKYRWTNTKHMRKPSIQRFRVDETVNASARFIAEHVSGPIRVAGAYGFTTRGDGVTNLWASSKSASLAKFPALGPAGLPKDRRRRFVTPFDLMIFGFNPLLPAYPQAGASWAAQVPSRDFSTFGVRGSTTVLGTRAVRVPAGTFNALVVRSQLRQRGFRFGSGTRTSYFAPGRGLVKLVFKHGDGSVSTVELLP